MSTREQRPADSTTIREPGAHRATGALSLVVVGDGHFASHTLPDSGHVVIGRSDHCEVRVDHPSISRRHARLHIASPLTVEDLGSANGTRVRDQQLVAHEPVTVTAGEVFHLGSMAVFVQDRGPALDARRTWPHEHFERRLSELCERAAVDGTTFAVARIRLGRRVSDAAVPDAIAGVLRADDVIGEYGAGEYELVLAGVTPVEAAELGKRIAAVLRAHGHTPAIGVACFPRDGRTADALIQIAGRAARGLARSEPDATPVVVTDPRMRELYEMIDRVAASNISVLLLGETGVGKEVLAQAVHDRSPRAGKPYLRLNVAALSETLLESELFGHERGAFTGAVAAKPGLLESADGGTVFLDELGEMPPSVQVKLLRVLETREVTRVGGLKPRAIDVRFVAATNRDLDAAIEGSAFRNDLYFRLSGITLAIPPLRERPSEIGPLAEAFVAQASAEMSRAAPPDISVAALALLEGYAWPGNIRELRNVMERAVVLCSGATIEPTHLPVDKLTASRAAAARAPEPAHARPVLESTSPPTAPATTASAPPTGDESVLDSARREAERVEREHILAALEECAGNQSKAAKSLGISRRTLLRRLDKYGVNRPLKGKPGDE